MATFYGLEVARRSLFTSQKGMDITGHNIANANTEGYTRQSVIFKSIKPAISYGFTTHGSYMQTGGGADIQEIRQIRDSFLDLQYRNEYSMYQEWQAKSEVLSYIEDIFSEPSDTGLNASMADFFNAIQELTKSPESIEVRTLVAQSAVKLTETIRFKREQLSNLQYQQDMVLDIAVQEVNDLIVNISDLNKQIFRFEMDGSKANDLRDTRNHLLDRLSGLLDISYYENEKGYFRVDFNGYPLVSHDEANLIETVSTAPNPVDDKSLNIIRWVDTKTELNITGGKIKGILDMRDGISPDNMGIPYFIRQLDDFAVSLANEFNEIHRQGYNIPGEGEASRNNINFFSIDTKYGGKTISVDQEILDNVYNIAASSEPVDMDNIGSRGNNINILKLAGLQTRKDIPGVGNFEDFSKKVISGLAVEASHTYKMADNQSILVNSISNRRQSVSGVSVDEELTNMITYQHAYSAAGRMVTAIDELLEILIRSTGLVGR